MPKGRSLRLYYVLNQSDRIGVVRYDEENLVIIFDAITKDMGVVVSHSLFYTLMRIGTCLIAYNECKRGDEGLNAECNPLWKDCLLNDQTFLGILEQMAKEFREQYEKLIGLKKTNK